MKLYPYDAAGNRQTYTIDGTQVATYTYNAANWLTQVSSPSSVVSYQYDDNGNLVNDGQFNYTYDSANRLTQLSGSNLTTQYEYNGDGVRVAQIVNGLRTDTVQDVALPLPQVLTAKQGATTANYLRGLGLIGEQQGGGAWQYYLADALGSIRQVVDAQGQVQLSQRYDPFGGMESINGLTTSRYGFAGEEQDPDTEQLFLRARTYNPATGRFLQQDSVLGSPTDPRTLHRYAYAFSNPANYTDPAGLMPGGSLGYLQRNEPPAQRPNRSYSPRSVTQVGYSSPATVNRNGFNSPYLGRADLSFTPPNRSVNGAGGQNWQPYSDPYARQQSQGHRPPTCGLVDLMVGLVLAGANGDLVPELISFAEQVAADVLPPLLPTADALSQWFQGQVQDIQQMWQTADWRMAASLAYGAVMTGAVAALAASGVGIPLLIAAGAGAVAANTMFNAILYDDLDNLGANLAGGGVEMAFGAVGGTIGGPAGWLIGSVIGAGVGQATTNVVSGEDWDEGLLANMLFSGVADGIGGAIGHGLGSRFGGRSQADGTVKVADGSGAGRHYKTDSNAPPRNHDIVLPDGRIVRTSPPPSPQKHDIILPDGRVVRTPPPEIGSQRHNYILEGLAYPPEGLGITPEMERAIMKSFPPGEDRLLGLRDRPLGAASLDGTIGLDAKAGWVRDWAVLEKHDKGVRELVDANKLIRGEYSHVTRGKKGWIFEMKGDEVFVKDDEFLPFVDNSINRLGQEVHANIYGDAKLVGQRTLSDVDGAFYAGVDANGNWIDLGDAYYKREFMEEFNKNYTVGGVPLSPRQHLISHGVFSDIPEDILKKLGIIPNRIEGMLAEQTLIYAHLPSQNIYGFYAVVPFEQVIIRLRLEKFEKYR